MKIIKKRRFFLILLPFILIIAHYLNFFVLAENLLTRAKQPLEVSLYKLSLVIKDSSINSGEEQNLEKENSKLRDQVQNLLIEKAHLQALLKEIELTKEQQKFIEENKLRAVPARVTRREGEILSSQKIFINKGSNAGVIKGAPAIIKEGIIIGLVTEVQNFSSQITLLNNPQVLINARVNNDAQSPGLVRGDFNLTLEMNYIPQTDLIEKGNLVITSGKDQLIPEGLIIGLVREIENFPGAIFQHVIIEPLTDTDSIAAVSIVIP